MFHVKHRLWCRFCSGRRVVCWRAGLLCVPVGGGPPASRPRCELRSARRLEARPGPATADGHRSQALRSLRRPPHRRHLVCWPGLAPPPPTGTTARPRALAGLVVSSALCRRSLPMGSTAWPATVEYPCGDALVERVVGEWCRVPATVCIKSAAHAGLRTCVELRRRRNSISGGQPSRCTWRRRAR